MKAAIYTRSSKDTHDVSPAAQRIELRAYAERKGYRIAADYSDAAVSANANPPQLAEMLRELKNPQRQWTIILAVESSRLARDMNLAGVIGHEVRKAGCRIEYSKMPSSGNAAMDVMVEAIARAWDQYHSMLSKEKGLAGMRTNVQLGHRAGGRAPLGYVLEHTATGAMRQGQPVTKSRLVPDPCWAPHVKRFLASRVAGQPRQEAARACGLKSKSASTLISIERNALTYAGHSVWNRHAENGPNRYRPREQWVLQRGTHEAFITEAQAEQLMAQAMPRPERRKRGMSGEFLLSGLLHTPQGKKLVGSGERHRRYYRAGKGRRIPAEMLETVVQVRMDEEIQSDQFVERFVGELRRAADALPTEPAQLTVECKALEKKITSLLKLAERLPDSASVAARLRELEAEQRELDEQIGNAEQAAATRRALLGTTRGDAQDLLKRQLAWMHYRYPSLEEPLDPGAAITVEEQRAALAQLVERIELDPATGAGRVHYRIGPSGARFELNAAAERLGLGKAGHSWRPHGDASLTPAAKYRL
jgi:site-specific DNA recombinase